MPLPIPPQVFNAWEKNKEHHKAITPAYSKQETGHTTRLPGGFLLKGFRQLLMRSRSWQLSSLKGTSSWIMWRNNSSHSRRVKAENLANLPYVFIVFLLIISKHVQQNIKLKSLVRPNKHQIYNSALRDAQNDRPPCLTCFWMLLGRKEAWTRFTACDMKTKKVSTVAYERRRKDEERTFCSSDPPSTSNKVIFPERYFTASCLPGFQLHHGAALWPGRHLVQFTWVLSFRILLPNTSEWSEFPRSIPGGTAPCCFALAQ